MDKPRWTSTRLGPEHENLSLAWLVPSQTSQAKLARLCLPSLLGNVTCFHLLPFICDQNINLYFLCLLPFFLVELVPTGLIVESFEFSAFGDPECFLVSV